MRYLLDTNVVSELRKPATKVDRGVLEWSQRHPLDAQYVSALTIFELEVGVQRKERVDPDQGVRLRLWLEGQVKPLFQERTLPFDSEVAVAAADVQAIDPRPLADLFIAATAQVHGLSVVTRNERDFANLGVRWVNPWSTRSR